LTFHSKWIIIGHRELERARNLSIGSTNIWTRKVSQYKSKGDKQNEI